MTARAIPTTWAPAKPSPADRNSRHGYHRRSGRRLADRNCPSICPSKAGGLIGLAFEFMRITLGGAMGIRTPDLLHAMNFSEFR